MLFVTRYIAPNVLIALSVLRPAAAQTVIETPEGRAEVIGLKRWTATMLADSLGLHAPGISLFQTKECTKALTSRLHFSSVYIEKTIRGRPGDNAQSVVVRLVEPQDSARIHWRRERGDSGSVPAEWLDLLTVLTDSAGTFKEGALVNPLGMYGLYLRDSTAAKDVAIRLGLDADRSLTMWRVLNRHRSERDRALALRAIMDDGNRRNRMLAAAILANFPQSDAAWRALAEALRDPYPGVNTAAMQSLILLGKDFARPVNWAPAAPGLRAVLDGTNLQAFLPLVRVLSQTSIAPALARPLLRRGGELLLANVAAADEPSHHAATALLLRLSGRAIAPKDWAAWVASL